MRGVDEVWGQLTDSKNTLYSQLSVESLQRGLSKLGVSIHYSHTLTYQTSSHVTLYHTISQVALSDHEVEQLFEELDSDQSGYTLSPSYVLMHPQHTCMHTQACTHTHSHIHTHTQCVYTLIIHICPYIYFTEQSATMSG